MYSLREGKLLEPLKEYSTWYEALLTSPNGGLFYKYNALASSRSPNPEYPIQQELIKNFHQDTPTIISGSIGFNTPEFLDLRFERVNLKDVIKSDFAFTILGMRVEGSIFPDDSVIVWGSYDGPAEAVYRNIEELIQEFKGAITELSNLNTNLTF